MDDVAALRAAAWLLRGNPAPEPHPKRLPPKMPEVYAAPLATLLEAEADGWPPPPVHTSTEPAARRRKAALALARAVNGTEP